MNEDLHAWNDGDGISLDMWIENEGNFKLSVGYCTMFWPQFELVGKYVLVAGIAAEVIADWETHPEHTERALEAVVNHLYLADFHMHDEKGLSADILLFLGNTLREVNEAKLQWQFPDRSFSVVFIIPEDLENFQDYQITFWQKKWEQRS